MFDQFQPGDVEILSIKLHSDDGMREYDLRQVVRSMDIYESIMAPVMVASLQIQDSIDLLRSFPIIGEEYVTMAFRVDPQTPVTELNLHVKEILDVRFGDQQTVKFYTLTLVSQELLTNASGGYINRRFNSEINTSIRNILENDLHTTKALNIEETRGIDNLLITRQQPFRAIDMLRRRAVSKRYASSSFTFFENRYGFNFLTLEGMFFEGAKNVGDRLFFADSNVNDDFRRSSYRNMIAYHQVQFADSIEKVSQGGMNNKVAVMDFHTGGYRVLNFDVAQADNTFKSMNQGAGGQNSSYFQQKHSRASSKTMLVPYDSSRNPLEIPEKISRSQSYAQRISQNIIQIFIWGDNEITAGNVVECNFPSAVGTTTTESRTDRLSSGKFLISKLRHMFTFGDKPVYTQSCELINGEMFESA